MTLLERCRAGDSAGWSQFFKERSQQVFRWSVLLGLSPADAEDAAQEVFAIAYRRIDSCHSDETMGSWLFQITRRVVANARRSSWLKRVLVGSDLPEPAFGKKDTPETWKEMTIRACLKRLPRPQAEVLVLLEIEGFTREEVADMLGIPPGTVASRLRLAKNAFRTHWEAMAEVPAEAALSWGER